MFLCCVYLAACVSLASFASPGDPDVLGVALAPEQDGAAGAAEVLRHQHRGRQGVSLGGRAVDPLYHRRSDRGVDRVRLLSESASFLNRHPPHTHTTVPIRAR